MKVILLDDIKKVGRRHEVKSVASGHARNFLIPKGFAVPATESNLKELERAREKTVKEERMRKELLMKSLESLKGTSVEIKKKATEEGHLFEGVGKEDILKALSQKRVELAEEYIELERPIKALGEYAIPVAVGEQKAEFNLVVGRSREGE